MVKFFGIGEDDDQKKGEKKVKKEDKKFDVGQIAIDILDTKEEVIILAPIAGIYLDNIDVSLDEGVLSIIGERKKPEIYGHASLKNSECFWGEFSRTIILPENLDFESIHASMENNLLVITIQKLQFTSQNIKIDRIES